MKEEKTDKELLLDEIKGLITDSQKEGVKKADLDKTIADLNEKIAKLSNSEIDKLPETVNKLIAEQAKLTASVNALTENVNTNVNKSVDMDPVTINQLLGNPKAFKRALLNAVKDTVKDIPTLVSEVESNGVKKISMKDYFLKLGNKNTPEMVVKATPVDMLEATIVQSNVATERMTILDPNRVSIPLAVYAHVIDWIPVKSIANKYMSILVVYDYQDGADTKTQGSSASGSSFLFKTVDFVSATIGTKFRVSDESLADLPEIMDEISRTAPSKIKDNIDYQILGSGGNDTTTIKGLYAASKHTDFASGTTYLAKVPNANKVDALVMMKDQAETSKYLVDSVILNPFDTRLIAAEKDQLDNSKIDRRVAFDALGSPVAVDGMLIRRNANQTANTVTVLAREMLQIGDRSGMTLEVGYDADDFSTGHKTVRINIRLAFAVRDALAVIYCSDLDAAVAEITS